MLAESKLATLKPTEDGKARKVADRDGLYVFISPSGSRSFRRDYRLNSRRETLTVGRYAPRPGGQARTMGVDPARFGNDSSVIFTRTGRDGRACCKSSPAA